jgi:hypothetical protein
MDASVSVKAAETAELDDDQHSRRASHSLSHPEPSRRRATRTLTYPAGRSTVLYGCSGTVEKCANMCS